MGVNYSTNCCEPSDDEKRESNLYNPSNVGSIKKRKTPKPEVKALKSE